MAKEDYNVLEILDDKVFKEFFELQRKAWYVLHNNVSQEYRVHDEDFMNFSEFCLKTSLEYSKRFIEND